MKTFRRILLVLTLVALVTIGLLALGYALENWRGARRWAETRRDLEARGESLDWSHFIPPPVPDDQNLALAPFFADAYQYKVDRNTGLLTFQPRGTAHAKEMSKDLPFGLDGFGEPPAVSRLDWTTAHAFDLSKLQAYYRTRADFPHAALPQSSAADVLLALTRFTPLLDALARDTATHPLARFPINWTQRPVEQIALPHDLLIERLNSTLRLRACAYLAQGDTEAAARDLALGFRLQHAIALDPFLITRVVESEGLRHLLQPVWEGIAQRRWSAPQLAALQTSLGESDLLAEYRRALRMERVTLLALKREDLHRPGGPANLLNLLSKTSGDEPFPGWMVAMFSLFPSGWYDEAAANACQLKQRYWIDAIDESNHRLTPRTMDRGANYVHRLPMRPNTSLAKIILPVSVVIAGRIARTQSAVDVAAVACALERFYLDRHVYPGSLSALVPTYLDHVPNDLIDGAPLRYVPTPDGRYRLYSVGWNAHDDGGQTVLYQGTSSVNDYAGDWVWQYEPVQPSPGTTQPGS